MRRLLVGLVSLTLAFATGCSGSREFELGMLSATRGADDHVTVVVPLVCSESGYDGCSFSECVSAAWGTGFESFDPFLVGNGVYANGTVMDKVEACSPQSVANGASTQVTLVSDLAISADQELAVLAFPQMGSGPGYDKETIIASP